MAEPLAVRDPIHGWIRFSDLERALIDTPLVQRLRYVGQLTSVNLVYPGGNNSRFEHSLGAMHVASMYADAVLPSLALPVGSTALIKQVLRVAALLHDIGHGPFSHSFDRTVYKKIYHSSLPSVGTEGREKTDGHDLHRYYIINNDESIVAALADLDVEPWMIECVWSGKPRSDGETVIDNYCEAMCPMIQGPLGADRMDFTMRDSYYTGTTHLGTIAHTRIIDHARMELTQNIITQYTQEAVIVATKRKRSVLVYSEKILGDAIHALDGRKYMYENVYLHKTAMAGSILIEQILAKLPGLEERTRDLKKFAFLNDMVLQEALTADPSLAAIARKFLLRQLPKLVYKERLTAANPVPDLSEYEDPEKFYICHTRSIGGVDPTQFDKYGILFAVEGDHFTCSESLEFVNYRAQDTVQYVRVYSL